MIKAQIINGVVVNIIVIDPANLPDLGGTLVDPEGAEIGGTWDGASFHPPVKELSFVKKQKISELQIMYDRDMAAGFQSNALGVAHFYRTDDGRIQLLAGAVASGQTVRFLATDGNGVAAIKTHTSVQILQVLNDGRLVAESLADKLILKMNAVSQATDQATVENINW